MEQLLGSTGFVSASCLQSILQGKHAAFCHRLQVLVGPGTPRPARPISDPVVADFLDTAPAGVVLAAFGTTIQTRTMLTASEFVELAHAFAAVAPTRVLWALREQGVPAGITLASLPLGSNTKLAAWVDFNVGAFYIQLVLPMCSGLVADCFLFVPFNMR